MVIPLIVDLTETIYSDLPGQLPTQSSKVNQYIFVLYHYDYNVILSELMQNRTDAEIFRAYAKLSNDLINRGMRPKLQILDNEASQSLQREIFTRHCNLQMVPPHMHRQNAAERAIRTFNNTFIAGLYSDHAEFPMNLWYRLLPQAILTLNLLETSILNS